MKKRTNFPSNVMIKTAWDNVLSCRKEIPEDMKANASKISLTQPVMLQFWSANSTINMTPIKRRKKSRLHIATTTSRFTSAKASRKAFKL